MKKVTYTVDDFVENQAIKAIQRDIEWNNEQIAGLLLDIEVRKKRIQEFQYRIEYLHKTGATIFKLEEYQRWRVQELLTDMSLTDWEKARSIELIYK